jgi:4-aminobutyrate aminotransferase/(S)-3-amino-2-methylpropionate transaminase
MARAATTRIEKEIGAGNVAAVIIEPVQGEGGFIVPAPGFIPALAEFCRANGIVFVADEIQSGFCRTGDWFASEHEGVVPDLITTAKGIAGGLPLAGVTGRAEMMDAVHAGGLGGTYGGNPVACAGALGAIRWMEDNDAPALARGIAELALPRLRALGAQYPSIGDIRGRGAMLAIELVKPGTTDPNPDLASAVSSHCHANGVITLTTGTYGNVLRFLPPLTMPEHLLMEAFDVIADGFAAHA